MSLATRSKSGQSRPSERIPKAFCEFFAGIGLVRDGLRHSGWECVYANDNDVRKQEQYAARFGDEHFHLGDVRDTKAVLSRLRERPILATASFPCIDLSLAGHWRGFQGEHSSTFFAFADVLAAMRHGRPKLVLIENVAGLLTSHDGKDFASVASSLADLDYYVDSFVIDAKHFVPQSRVRVFLIGVHRSVVDKCKVTKSDGSGLDRWNTAVHSARSVRPVRLIRLMEQTDLATGWIATRIKQPPTERQHLREVIDLDDAQEWWEQAQVDKHYDMMSDLHRMLVDEMMRDTKAVQVGTIFRRKRYGKTRAEVRFDGMAGCLRVPRGGSARQIVIVIDRGRLRIRWMSPKEYARLQGAPDFPLVGRPNQQMSGFGDAVCVPVIRWIDREVLTPMYDAIVK